MPFRHMLFKATSNLLAFVDAFVIRICCKALLGGVALSLSLVSQAVEIEVLDKKGRPVSGVVVSIHNDTFAAPKPVTIELKQEDKRFSPQMSLVTVGSTVNFSNRDIITHHVYSFSKPWRQRFRMTRDEVRSEVMNEPGEIVIGCNIHDWMLSYIYVMDTPYYATTDDNGRVKFDNVPVSESVMRVRHPRIRDSRGVITSSISIKEGEQERTIVRLKKGLLPERDQVPDEDYP